MSGIVCGHCGASNPEGQRFCQNCDEFLDWEGTPAEPEPAPRPRPAPASGPTALPGSGSGNPGPPARAAGTPSTRPPGTGSAPSRPAARAAGATRPVSPARPATPPRTARPTDRQEPQSGPGAEEFAAIRVIPEPPTTLICAYCGTENDPNRRFCHHCGQWLVVPSATPATPPPAFKQQLKQRWFGERSPYTGRLSRATVWFRVASGVVALVVATVVLTLAGFHPIRRVEDQVGHIRGSGKLIGNDLTVTAQPAGSPRADTAKAAVDDVRNNGWETDWTAPGTGNPADACTGAPGGTPSAGTTSTNLTVTFGSPVDIREIGFEAGRKEAEERTNRYQPRTLELHWSNHQSNQPSKQHCQPVTLANDSGLQRFWVNEGLVSSVTITIVAGYGPASPGPGQLEIGEIIFWQR